MRLTLLLFICFIAITTFGQNTIRLQVLSEIDNKPLSNFLLRVHKKKFMATDSTGIIEIPVTKNKVKISYPYTRTKSKDTTIIVSGANNNIKLFTLNSWDSTQAKSDVQHGDFVLFCCFGFLLSAPNQLDKEFEKEFGVKYYSIGDAPPVPLNKLITYNLTVGKYLDRKFGTKWRRKTKAYF